MILEKELQELWIIYHQKSDPPQILKRAAGFTTTMWLSLSSSTWSDLELGDYAERYLVDQFSSIKNVGRILVGGLRELSIRVWVDPIKLAANDLTIKEVELQCVVKI